MNMRLPFKLVFSSTLAVAASSLPALAQTNPYAPLVTTPPGPQNPMNLNLEDPGAPMMTSPAFTNSNGTGAWSPSSTASGPVDTPSPSSGMSFGGNAPGIGAGGLSVVPGGVR